MALFRRAPRGRHALGAAVTSIPSGPLQELVVVPVAPTVVEAPAPSPEPSWHQAAAAQPHVMASIAELIATGEAWSTEPPQPPTWREPAEAPAAPVVVEEPVVLAAPAPPAPPAPVVPARTALENALADLLPQQSDGPVPMSPSLEVPLAPLAPAPRVKLGFRDGTSTSLDPSSSQSRALQELARSLTRRD